MFNFRALEGALQHGVQAAVASGALEKAGAMAVSHFASPHAPAGPHPPGMPGAKALPDEKAFLSSCTGKKKALFIGINYFGTPNELKGCLNDVKALFNFITSHPQWGFGFENITVINDEAGTETPPTGANIRAAMKWLVDGAQAGDSLFFHYSGHGGTQKDVDGDEADGMDETIIPADYQTNGMIVDDEIWEIMVKNLPQGVRLTCIFDSCHSGSVMDLPITYNIDGQLEITETDNRKLAVAAFVSTAQHLMKGDKRGALEAGMQTAKYLMAMRNNKGGSAEQQEEELRRRMLQRPANADVVQFSGCRDDQTSADACFSGTANGALSYSFIQAFKQQPEHTYTSLLKALRVNMEQGQFQQVPQMSTGYYMVMSTPFKM